MWVVYSGVETCRATVVNHMMQFNVFRESVHRSTQTLKQFGINLNHLIQKPSGDDEENFVNTIVYTTAVQIALTDLMSSLEIVPDGMIGHSVGEIGCAYADKSLTAEQALQVSYWTGRAIFDSRIAENAVTSIDLTWEECKNRCPTDVHPIFYNCHKNVVVAGPLNSMRSFVEQLQSENVTGDIISSNSFEYHIHGTKDTLSKLTALLKEIISDPKERSSKWVSSTYLRKGLCSAEYFIDNLVEPVLFYEACRYIPEDAALIEISPHGLMQTIIDQNLSSENTYISLMDCHSSDNAVHFLKSIGSLYNCGGQPCVSTLYPQITFPVSRGTPMISPLVKWDHSVEWFVPKYLPKSSTLAKTSITIDLNKDEYRYLEGHAVNGRIVYPASGYLVLLWKTLAKINSQNFDDMPIIIKNVQLHKATEISKSKPSTLLINILENSGSFEISDSDCLVVSGSISIVKDRNVTLSPETRAERMCLNKNDVYQELRLRGYSYEGDFCSVCESDVEGKNGVICWNKNWVTFIDGMLQFALIGLHTRDLLLPVGIEQVIIDPSLHAAALKKAQEENLMPICIDTDAATIISGGVKITHLKPKSVQLENKEDPGLILETYQFVPYCSTISVEDNDEALLQALHKTLKVALENIYDLQVMRIVEVPDGDSLAPMAIPIIQSETLAQIKYTVVNARESDLPKLKDAGVHCVKKDAFKEKAHLLILTKPPNLELLEKADWLLLAEQFDTDFSQIGWETISVQTCTANSTKYKLLRKLPEDIYTPCVVKISGSDYLWIDSLKNALREKAKIILVAQGEPHSGLLGLVNCLKKEAGGDRISSYFLPKGSQIFNHTSPFYARQIKKNLLHNVLNCNNVWGRYCHLPFVPSCSFLQSEQASVCENMWVECPFSTGRFEKRCNVYFACLNQEHIRNEGHLFGTDGKNLRCIGFEFSGRDDTGKRVMGISSSRKLTTNCKALPGVLYEVPDNWSLEEAATVPLAYSLSYYALLIRGRMEAEESVLIDFNGDNVGIAAIRIALNKRCVVFGAATNHQTQKYLYETFGQLTNFHIGSLGDPTFKKAVMTLTQSKGVDLVLHLTDKGMINYLDYVSPDGRLIQVKTNDSQSQFTILCSKNRSFYSIDPHEFLTTDNCTIHQTAQLFNKGLCDGTVAPFSRIVYEYDKIKDVPARNDKQNVLIRIRDENEVQSVKFQVNDSTKVYPEKVYIIIGGLGGFGLELVNWLILRGACKLILTSRSGFKTGYQKLCLYRWKQNGVQLNISTVDASTIEGAQELITLATALGNIGGIFNVALQLKNVLMEFQTEADFKSVARSKTDITTNLDILSRKLLVKPDYFVVFSSIVCGRGNIGQTNYGFANSSIERICETRRADGLAGLAIQWGAIGDVGYSANALLHNNIEIEGHYAQSIRSCLATMEIFLQQPYPVVSSRVFATTFKENGHKSIPFLDKIAKLLSVTDLSKVSQTATLLDLGMDSLMQLGLQQILKQQYGLVFNNAEISNLTVKQLVQINNEQPAIGDVADVYQNFELQFELLDQNVIIKMKSKSVGLTNPVFFVHPVQGTVDTLKTLAKHINSPVYGIQCTKDSPYHSITELAKHYVQQIRLVQPHGPYVVLGYSFGACVSFEIGLLLEAYQEKVTLFLIDGSPTTILGQFNQHGYNMDVILYRYYASLFGNNTKTQVLNQLRTCNTIEEKMSYAAGRFSKSLPYSYEDIMESVKCFCSCMLSATEYKPTSIFQGNITLVRTKEFPLLEEDDYGLSVFCTQKVNVCPLESNHLTIVAGKCVVKIGELLNHIL